MDRIFIRRKVYELAEAIILKGKLLRHTEGIYEIRTRRLSFSKERWDVKNIAYPTVGPTGSYAPTRGSSSFQ